MATRLRDRMPLLDRLRYVAWRLARRTTPIDVHLDLGPRVRMRPSPAMDVTIAHEVFVRNVYDPPDGVQLPPDSVRRVVDLGANIGCTCLLWLSRYPEARVEAFEPHPGYAKQLRYNLAMNGWTDRVELCEAAAGTTEGTMYLTDAEAFSRVVAGPGHDRASEVMKLFGHADASATPRERLPIRAIDVFAALGNEHIDLLKIDIEGGEHSLMDDPRFADLPTRALVMEWHDTEEHPDGRAHALATLFASGYRVVAGLTDEPGAGRLPTGMIWATRT